VAIMFLAPPFRRPYELYYFCSLTTDVIVVVDNISYNRYSDYYDREFLGLKYQYFLVPIHSVGIGKFLNFGSTAALINYDDTDLYKIIRDKNVTTIITVEAFSSLSGQASRLSSKLSLKHIVITWDNIKNSPFSYIPPFSVNIRRCKSSTHKFITVSNKSKEALVSLRIHEDKIETIYPGIFVNKFKPSLDNTGNKILFVGDLEPNKGIKILLQAFKKLSSRLSDIQLTLVGSGSLEGEIRKFRDSGLMIDYKGYIPPSKLSEIYAHNSVFCSPSLEWRFKLILIQQEQFGFALVEAMASGLPLVTSNVGTIPEVVGKRNLVVTPNIDNVSAALYKLLTCENLRKELRDNNRNMSISRYDAIKQSKLFGKVMCDL
jgi:glycosyltransferase involved in cell wall biosynthesis